MIKQYKSLISAGDVLPRLQEEWKAHKQKMYEGKAPSFTFPKPVKVGEFGMYDIVVRASESEGNWSYDGGIQSPGSVNRQGGFKSVQAVIDWAIENAKESYIEFYEKYPNLK
jgi:hypothetical protein